MPEWMHSFGRLARVGVEGTGSYGAGLSRHMLTEGIEMVEVNRPNRRTHHQRGKSDPLDTEAASASA